MPEIVVLSGKGGTGKTSFTAALATLAQDAIICDLDVDAPDLHLLLRPEARQREEFWSGGLAVIDQERCTDCGRCAELCRFEAIKVVDGHHQVDPMHCEGCKVCVALCPEQAAEMTPRHCGHWQVSDTRLGPMVHAQLFPGQENSGRLVALLRQHARELSQTEGRGLILCDGPPGIGCPVISSLSGTDLAVLVTEPTPSGLHDLMRVAELCGHFKVPTAVVINKCDLSDTGARALEEQCAREGLIVVAHLPFDPAWSRALVEGRTMVELGGPISEHITKAWERIRALAPETKDRSAA